MLRPILAFQAALVLQKAAEEAGKGTQVFQGLRRTLVLELADQ